MSEQETAAAAENGPGTGGSYEEAVKRLDEIIGRLDSGDAELRETLELCSEAKGLIEYCAGELAAVDQGLKELRLEELAASLAGGRAADNGPAEDGGEAIPEDPGPEPGPADHDVPF